MAPDELQEKGLAELRTMAKALGVKNVGKYRKNELIEMLSGKSETPAPKKRGRPTKAAAAQKPAAKRSFFRYSSTPGRSLRAPPRRWWA